MTSIENQLVMYRSDIRCLSMTKLFPYHRIRVKNHEYIDDKHDVRDSIHQLVKRAHFHVKRPSERDENGIVYHRYG